uniref:Uncharacterized protein n=1 Tax=Anguilla anguilla TaxID=7936 RepID=A0A0E9TGE2_ANGAN
MSAVDLRVRLCRVCMCVYVEQRCNVHVMLAIRAHEAVCSVTWLKDAPTWSHIPGASAGAALALAVSDGQREAVLPFHQVT